MSSLAQAQHSDFTHVSGISSRQDSKVYLALADQSYIYSPMSLTFGSAYDCNYSITVNGTIYRAGVIDISRRAVLSLDIVFPESGRQKFIVQIGSDTYEYTVHVLKRSFESQVREEVIAELGVPQPSYFMRDLQKVFGASLVGALLAVFLAYWFKIDRIRQEPRRLL